MTKDLDKPARKSARIAAKGRRKPWTPERRAKQAERARSTQPWAKSTGPRTAAGKARAAANALKHGFRSRAFVERIREERQLVRDAAAIIALAKSVLRTVEARSLRGPHVTVWTGDPHLDGAPNRGAPDCGPRCIDER